MLGLRSFSAMALAIFVGATGSVCADQTQVGVTVNGTTGGHITSDATSVIPFVPLPIFEIRHTHKNWSLQAEIVPPIGPVSLTSGGGYGASQDPRVSYLNGEALYTLPNGRYAFGIGETVINQRTSYLPNPVAQASRVVGARYIARFLLHSSVGERIDARIAVNPSLHGVQYTMLPAGYAPGAAATTLADPELGSLVDASLRVHIPHARYGFSYGIRYLNYVAHYAANQQLADRNHLFMPFVGFDWIVGRATRIQSLASVMPSTVAVSRSDRRNKTIVGLRLGGANGSQTSNFGNSAVPIRFALVPMFFAAHKSGRIEVRAEGSLPRANANLFGRQNLLWSYVGADILYSSQNGRYAFGIGDTAINQKVPQQFGPWISSRAHSEGLRYTVTDVVVTNARGRLEARLSVNPHLSVANYNTLAAEPMPEPSSEPIETVQEPQTTFISHRFGSLTDASLRWAVPRGPYTFSYGLRYINNTLNLSTGFRSPGSQTATLLEHFTSLVPFFGVSTQLGH